MLLFVLELFIWSLVSLAPNLVSNLRRPGRRAGIFVLTSVFIFMSVYIFGSLAVVVKISVVAFLFVSSSSISWIIVSYLFLRFLAIRTVLSTFSGPSMTIFPSVWSTEYSLFSVVTLFLLSEFFLSLLLLLLFPLFLFMVLLPLPFSAISLVPFALSLVSFLPVAFAASLFAPVIRFPLILKTLMSVPFNFIPLNFVPFTMVPFTLGAVTFSSVNFSRITIVPLASITFTPTLVPLRVTSTTLDSLITMPGSFEWIKRSSVTLLMLSLEIFSTRVQFSPPLTTSSSVSPPYIMALSEGIKPLAIARSVPQTINTCVNTSEMAWNETNAWLIRRRESELLN